MTAKFEALIQVDDQETLLAFARTLNPDLDAVPTVEEALAESLVNPRAAPLDSGYEIHSFGVTRRPDGKYLFALDAEVLDVGALLAAASESYRTSWGEEMEAENMGEALYEHVLASNASPAPLDIGFEVVDRRFEGPPLPAAPMP